MILGDRSFIKTTNAYRVLLIVPALVLAALSGAMIGLSHPLERILVSVVSVGTLLLLAMAKPEAAMWLALLLQFSNQSESPILRQVFPFSPYWILLLGATASQLGRVVLERSSFFLRPKLLILLPVAFAIFAVFDLNTPVIRGMWANNMSLPLLVGLGIYVVLTNSRDRFAPKAGFVLLASCYVLLALDVGPILLGGWGTSFGALRSQFGMEYGALRIATTVAWLFNLGAAFFLSASLKLPSPWRVGSLAFGSGLAVLSLLTFSRGAFLGLGILLVAMVARFGWKNLRGVFTAVAIAVGLYFVSLESGAFAFALGHKGLYFETTTYGRLHLLITGIQQIPQHLVFGRGSIGSYNHSAVLDSILNYGFLFSLIFWVPILFLFRESYRKVKQFSLGSTYDISSALVLGTHVAFVVALAQSVLDPVFFDMSFSTLFWLMRAFEERAAFHLDTEQAGL